MRTGFFYSRIRSLAIIGPDKSIVQKVIFSLALIKKTDPREFSNLFSRLKIVFITRKYGFTNEFFMPEKIWFANRSIIEKNDMAWLASLIIHEAFHATQFKKGRYILPLTRLEPPALKIQENFLKKLENADLILGVKSAKREKYWRKMRNDKGSFAYFRRLLNLLETNRLTLRKI